MVTKVKIDPTKLDVNWSSTASYRIEVEEGFVREVGNNRTPSPEQTSASVFSTTSFLSPLPNIVKTTADGVFFNNNSSTFAIVNLKAGNRGAVFQSTASSNLYVYSTGNSLLQTISISSSTRVYYQNDQVAFRFDNLGLSTNTTYHLRGDSGVAKDMFNNLTTQFTTATQVVFTTSNYISPTPIQTILTPLHNNRQWVSMNENYIAFGASAGPSVLVYNNQGELISTIAKNETGFGKNVHINNTNLLTCSDSAAYVYSTTSTVLLRTHTATIFTSAMSGDKYSIMESGSGKTTLYSTTNTGFSATLTNSVSTLNIVRNSPLSMSSKYTAISTNNNVISVFSNVNGTLLHSTSIGASNAWSISLTDQYLVTGSAVGVARVYSVSDSSLTLLYSLTYPESGTGNVTTYVTNDYIFLTAEFSSGFYTNTGRIFVYNTSDGSLLHTIDPPAVNASEPFSQYGWSIACNSKNVVAGYRVSPFKFYRYQLP
jgi:hypothetical protein